MLPLPSGGRLRAWTLAEAPTLAALANERAIWRNMRDQFAHPYHVANAAFFIGEMANKPNGDLILAIETAAGSVAGSVGIHFKADVNRRSAEVGYWLGKAFWGRGLATEAISALTHYAFTTYDLARLYALVFAWNPASGRVLEKAGFTLEARLRDAVTKDGETTDGLLYAHLRRDWPTR
ncbi:MAG: GNAT family N-acetyltransferase [Hymenobacteraceae bacterium]|nr:GNAT family N-acetyltransferase [Hymenobacteraceae bacterium]